MKQIRDLMKMLCADYGITIMISSHILSEVESIAHTIGMIHHGRLINEISMEEIEEKNTAYIELGVNDTKRTAYLLSEELKLLSFRIMDTGEIRIYDKQISPQAISKVLGANGVEIRVLRKKSETLEDYFLKMTAEV